jgi:UDP-N-acetylmuramate dehydrogenase
MEERLLQRISCEENVSLKEYSTFKIGGKVKYLFKPKTVKELTGLIQSLNNKKKNYHIIGRGSNILFADKMKTETIITTTGIKQLHTDQDKISADCGVPLREFCYTALKQNLSGAEGLSGIPGTVGGAVYMNAGAYTYSMDQILESVLVYDMKTKNIKTLSNMDCQFSYRKSIFMKTPLIILNATFQLKKQTNNIGIKNLVKDFEQRRSEKQPLHLPSAGSVFKKPNEKFYPAKEIQELGLKGFCIGDACVSNKHSGFIVNLNQATSEDVLNLIAYIQEKVFKKTGFLLHTEIKYLD